MIKIKVVMLEPVINHLKQLLKNSKFKSAYEKELKTLHSKGHVTIEEEHRLRKYTLIERKHMYARALVKKGRRSSEGINNILIWKFGTGLPVDIIKDIIKRNRR